MAVSTTVIRRVFINRIYVIDAQRASPLAARSKASHTCPHDEGNTRITISAACHSNRQKRVRGSKRRAPFRVGQTGAQPLISPQKSAPLYKGPRQTLYTQPYPSAHLPAMLAHRRSLSVRSAGEPDRGVHAVERRGVCVEGRLQRQPELYRQRIEPARRPCRGLPLLRTARPAQHYLVEPDRPRMGRRQDDRRARRVRRHPPPRRALARRAASPHSLRPCRHPKSKR